jgi:hypothetical protein
MVSKCNRARDMGGKNGDGHCKDIMDPWEKQVNKIDRGDRALGVCRHFMMKAVETSTKNDNMDKDIDGRWQIPNPPIPGFG